MKYKDHIRLIIADVDGTLTDGRIAVSDSGEQTRRFHSRDGLAMRKLIENGYQVGIITAALTAGSVTTRAKMLGVQWLYVGLDNKLDVLKRWCEELNITPDQVAYVGDDILDLEIMQVVGLSACPANAVDKIKKIATTILTKDGGDACFREFTDLYFDVC